MIAEIISSVAMSTGARTATTVASKFATAAISTALGCVISNEINKKQQEKLAGVIAGFDPKAPDYLDKCNEECNKVKAEMIVSSCLISGGTAAVGCIGHTVITNLLNK